MDATTEADPAAAAALVFRDVLLREIGEENEQLKDSTCFASLLEHIQKVELVAVTNEAPVQMMIPGVNGNRLAGSEPGTANFETIAAVYLSQGSVVDFGRACNLENEMLVIPVTCPQSILLHNLGIAGGITVRVSGRSIGLFPRDSLSFKTIVEFTDDNTVLLTIHISESVLIKGEVYDPIVCARLSVSTTRRLTFISLHYIQAL